MEYSYFEYCVQFRSLHLKNNIVKLEKVHRRARKMIRTTVAGETEKAKTFQLGNIRGRDIDRCL